MLAICKSIYSPLPNREAQSEILEEKPPVQVKFTIHSTALMSLSQKQAASKNCSRARRDN
jgi:hypothetical protein